MVETERVWYANFQGAAAENAKIPSVDSMVVSYHSDNHVPVALKEGDYH